VLTVHGDLYWTSPTQIAAEILRFVFCSRGTCSADRAQRFARVPASRAVDVARAAESRARSRHDPLSPVDSG
jgi:hypothetical protein